MPRGQVGVELHDDKWVRGQRAEIGHGQVRGAMEGEFERVSCGRARDGRRVMTAGWWGFFRFVAFVADFLFEIAGFIYEFGREGVGVVDVG